MQWRAIFVVFAAFPALLRSELLPIRTYNTADGLAADHVDCVVSDSRGFLWFCTPEGLSRFDGNHFVSYGISEGLPHQSVSAFLETRSGDHWIGTARGMARINSGSSGAPFVTYRPGQEANQNYIGTLLEARSGGIWCATADGLFRWNAPLSFRRKELPIPHPIITDVVESTSGDLWVGTMGGIFFLANNGVVRNFTVKDGLPSQWVEALLLDSKRRIWAALRGGLVLITERAAGDWRVEKIYRPESGLSHWDVKALLEASDGTLWVGTAYGISRLRLSESDPQVFQNLTRAQGLSDQQIIALAEDPAGNIWAGTEGAGAMRIARVGFTTYRESDGLDTDRVMSVFEDRAGALVTVTSGPGGPSINLFDGKRFRILAPKEFREHPTWGWHQILLQSRTGEWWAATKQGLCRFRATKAAGLDAKNPQVCYSRDSIFFRVFEDSKGGIWASAQSKAGDRLMRWNPDTNTIFDFPASRIPGEPARGLVSAFAEDRQGNVWMGMYSGGLDRYNGRDFRHFQHKDGLPAGSIFALLADEGGLWVGSNNGGLGRIVNTSEERLRIEVYNTDRGMASNSIQSLVEDLQGRIYAGTGKGVDRLDPKSGHIRHFSSADGLAHGELKSAVRDRSGSLWFATTQGLSRLTTTEDRPSVVPRVLITDLQIGGAAYPVSQLGEIRVSDLELKPSQNQLRVDFVGVDYEPGKTIRYSYKLEGADSGWSPPRNQQTVNYAALEARSYRFLVKAVTSEGVESAVPAEIDFTVLPPLWRRWWFESLAAGLGIGLVFAAHRYRVTQVVNLERMRTAIATDLHDDIGASLSQIAILSEVARVGADGQNRAGEPLERIASLARELVDSMGDIVWSISSEPHGMDSLIRRMREFALDLLASQGIDFELRTPQTREDVELTLHARRQLFLIFKECIHNVARHSHCAKVLAEFKILDRELLLTVQDDGSGLNPGQHPPGSNGGTGIPSMRGRAQSLGGRVEITSTPGGGCTVSIHLPARRGVLTQRL
jgi:ligand-binding sensor domain-containing protein/two-component sensor histidine kinase